MRRISSALVAAVSVSVAALLLGSLAGCAGRGQASPLPRTGSNSATTSGPTPTPSRTEAVLGQRPPTGFVPATASFADGADGFAWGVYPCAANSDTFCPGFGVTRDGGATWKLRNAPTGLPVDPYHRAILRFADAFNGWAVNGNLLQSTHDGAVTWQSVTLPGLAEPNIAAIAPTSSTVFVVAGSASGPLRLFRSDIGADIFTPVDGVTLPTPGASVRLSFASDGSGYLTGDSIAEPDPIFYASADGEVWVPRASPCGAGARTAVAAALAGSVSVTCDVQPSRTGASKQLWRSSDGGLTFTAIDGPAAIGFTAGVAALTLPDPATGTAGSAGSSATSYVVAASALEDRLYVSLNGGRSWTVAYGSSSDASGSALGMADLQFTDANHGIVILGNAGIFAKDRLAGSRAVLQPRLLVTVDGGRHWAQSVIQ